MARPSPGGSRPASSRARAAAPAETPVPTRAPDRARASARPASRPAVEAGPPAWWEGLSPLLRHVVCVAFLFVVALGVSAPIVFGSGSLIGHDAVEWRSMAASMLDYHRATGQEPLWATNPFGGMPGVMVTHVASVPGADSVFSALRPALWPFSHLMALLVGLYGLVYRLTRRHGAAVVAALVFAFTTYLPVILGAGHNSKFIALCYTPALFWAFAEAVRRPRLLAALLFAVALGLHVRAGHPQITYYAGVALFVWWIAEGVGSVRAGQGARFGRATAFLALGGVLALGMAAHPLVEQLTYKNYTIRGAESASTTGADDAFAYAMRWSQGAGELLTLLVADAFGGGGGTYYGPKTMGTSGPHYVGGVAVALALIGLAYGRRRVAWSLGAALALMLLFSLGENLAGFNRLAYDALPLFKSFRVPETWLSVAAFLIALLAGLGLAAVLRPDADADTGRPSGSTSAAGSARTGGLYVALGVLAFVGLLFALKGSRSYERPGERAQIAQMVAQQNGVDASDPRVAQAADQYLAEQVPQRVAAYQGDLLRTLLAVGALALLLWLVRRGTVPAWALGPALALVVAVDLGGVWQRYLSADRLVPARAPEELIEKRAYDDFVLARVAEAGGPGRFRTLDLSGGDLASSARPAAFYETLSGYHGAKLRLYQDVLDHVLVTPQGGLNVNALRLLGVRYVAAPGPVAPGLAAVYVDSAARIAVFETPAPGGSPATASPSDSASTTAPAAGDSLAAAASGAASGATGRSDRAWFASSVEALAADSLVWQRLQDPAFDVHRTALVVSTDGPAPTTTPIGPASTARATLRSYGPTEIVYDVETDAPRLLVLSEVYYPEGWTATVGTASAAIHRVDHLLRGVAVPAGRHTVTLRYAPAAQRTGLAIAGVSSALVYGGLLVLLGLPYVRRRRAPEPDAVAAPADVAGAGSPGESPDETPARASDDPTRRPADPA